MRPGWTHLPLPSGARAWRYVRADGAVLDVALADRDPDAPRGGQVVSCGGAWWRRDGGPWRPSAMRGAYATMSAVEHDTVEVML